MTDAERTTLLGGATDLIRICHEYDLSISPLAVQLAECYANELERIFGVKKWKPGRPPCVDVPVAG